MPSDCIHVPKTDPWQPPQAAGHPFINYKNMNNQRFIQMRSGVYMLRSKQSPEICYVGSSKNLIMRSNKHKNLLKRGISAHSRLQDHVNDFGFDDLQFKIPERCSIDELEGREQFWLIELCPSLNSNLIAKRPIVGVIHEHPAKYTPFNSELEREVKALCNRDIFPEIIVQLDDIKEFI